MTQSTSGYLIEDFGLSVNQMLACSAQLVFGGPAASLDAMRSLVDEGGPSLGARGWRSASFAVGFGLSEFQYIDSHD